MSYKTHQHHRDRNHKEIADALRGAGYAVIELQVVDLIVISRDHTVAAEIKMVSGEYSLGQLEFLATNPGYSAIWKTPEEALMTMKFPAVYCLNDQQKRKVLQIVHRFGAKSTAKNPRISANVFERELAA